MTGRASLYRRAALTWRTVRHMRAAQALRYALRGIHRPHAPLGRPLAPRAASGSWVCPPLWRREWVDESTIRIFSQSASVLSPADWRRAFPDALRRYHLHYLDQLRAESHPTSLFPTLLLERWIAENPPGSRPGWEPYPISRRIVNVVKALLAGYQASEMVLTSIADQCRFLVPRIEFHLLANHLLANAKALVFAGAFLSGAEADGWLALGLRILRTEIREQVLADGGHVERSPMYHAMVLEDLLDLLNLGRRYNIGALEILCQPCRDMLTWYKAMRHPDGAIPLFNDSALEAAIPFPELSLYGSRLGVSAAMGLELDGVTLLRDSGYVRVSSAPWHLFADVGSVGPGYQPGHAHAGTLGYELSVGAERVLVDTGVSTYSRGAVRQNERSTAAHNTVVIERADSSEVWDAFRVGARARVAELSVTRQDDSVLVSAFHDGYRRLKCRAVHLRSWRANERGLDIEDEMRGVGTVQIESILHFAPGCEIKKADGHGFSVRTPAGIDLALQVDQAADWRVESYLYAPSFGVQVAATAVRGRLRARLPQKLWVRFTREANT